MKNKESSRPVPGRHMMLRYRDGMDVYGIVHFGLNTYTDREWGFGDEDPAMFNPGRFDADQIVEACRAGGLKGLVIVCKHHDGFCLWPTKTTEHNISKSPFRGGAGDYVREMAEACAAHGLKCGFYVSPWDRNSALYATPEYVDMYWKQVLEIAGGAYGPVFEMWFDCANGGDGYYGGARETRKIPADYYHFPELFKKIRELNPDTAIFCDNIGDLHWPGNESGELHPEARCSYPAADDTTTPGCEKPLFRGDPAGSLWSQPECDFPLRPGWFFHESENSGVKSPAKLLSIYLDTVGNGGTMDIGIAPDREGRLHANDAAALRGFNEIRSKFFSDKKAEAVFDGGSGELVLPHGASFNVVELSEDVENGELIDGYEFSVDDNGSRKTLLRGMSIGVKRIRFFKHPVETEKARLEITASSGAVRSVSVTLYSAPQELIDAVLAVNSRTQVKPETYRAGEQDAADDSSITFKFAPACTFKEALFTPDEKNPDGIPLKCSISISADGIKWDAVPGEFDFANVLANPIPQKITLQSAVHTSFIKITAIRKVSQDAIMSCREFGIIAAD